MADGLGNVVDSKVQIIDIGLRNSSRVKRALLDSKKALKRALELDCDIYHLHDPELLKIGLKLKKHKKKVIFDAHEDLPQQILTKEYIPKLFRKAIAVYYGFYESVVSKKLDAIVSATPSIHKKFKAYGAHSITVCNYPKLNEINKSKVRNENHLVYIGGISEARGIIKILDALDRLDCKLELAGKFFDTEIELKAKAHPAWNKVIWHGFVNSEKIQQILETATIGLVILKGFKSYRESLPVKMFEYMNASIPFIASNFEIWEEIAKSDACGICVDPDDVDEIVEAIQSLLSNSKKRTEMGKNGEKAVNLKYNWRSEEVKLMHLYESFLNA